MALYTVTTTADSGAGSLSEAILDANATAANDEIVFASSIVLNGVSTIALGAAFPAIAATSGAGSLTISGPGAASLIIDAQQGNYSIFKINAGGNLTISGVTVTGANLSGSGGAFSNSGVLNIYSSTITGNSVTGNGGGINNNGSLNIFNSTISGNTSSGSSSTNDNYGGGINNSGTLTISNSTLANNTGKFGGGINNSQGGTLTVTNSTLFGNTATAYGGGINNYNDLTVTNCTFSGNSAAIAGGLQNNGTLNIANTIIANSSSGGDYFGGGTISTNLNNLVEDGTLNDTTGNSSGSGNISGDPLLSPLANNGGPTFTMALGATSPAKAAGNATYSNATSIFDLDQRGYARSSTTPSIGAFEYNGAVPAAPTVTGVSPSTGSAAGGNSITITGTNLAGATAVSIGGTAVNFTVVSPTSITTTTPAHTAGAVSIKVTTVGGTNQANTLYSYVPTVTQNLSNLANNATTLTITGTGFDPIAANNTVTLSSGTGTVTSATATQLTVTFITAPIQEELRAEVFTNGISSGNQVEVATIVLAPVVTSISPAAGPRAGGSTIIINGSSFINVTGVTIGGIAATNFTVVNGQKITATIPPGVFGTADVLVTTNDGTNSTTANTKFNYTAGAFDAPVEPFVPAFPHAKSIDAPGSVVGTSASFTVTFNQPVTGLDATDFSLITTGTVAGGTISSITGSGDTYTVNVTGITGTGTLGLNLVSVPTINALPSFEDAAQPTVATGSKPASVSMGDVNGDGELDIITANFNSANVSVLLGNGNGTFQGQQTFATGTNPFAVKLGDINGDGSVDIITANQGSKNASVLLGNGDGTFQAQTTFATGTQPRSVALADVNGDGTLDIITANQNSNNVSVLLGTGNGNFAGQATFSTANGPYSVALGDVNGDGKLDIVTPNQGSNFNVSVLLGNGDGTFQNNLPSTTGSNPRSVVLGDVNGDGKLDIVTANNGTSISVLIGNGNGTFQSRQNFEAGENPRSVTLGDVNGDGRLDIITANFGSTANNTSVLLGNGNGTFQGAAIFATGTNSRSATLGDVNGDGRLDIIAANYNSDNASVILGTGGSAMFATFSPQQTFAAGNGAQSQALGDLNGDGKLDMVTANGSAATASVLLGNGNGTFQSQVTFATGSGPRSVTLGDVNDDGRLDIITANRESNTASVLLGNGNGTFQTQTTFATGNRPYSVALGDVNGDGRLDIITANNNDNNASVLLGNGNGTFQTQATFATGSSPRAVAMGDVNSDGKLDIITANHDDASASVLLGNGNGTFKPKADFATGSNPRALTLGDVNGDGNLDIITANFANSVSVLLGNGNGTFQTQATFATGTQPDSVTLGDINGDGRLDIITANYSSDTASVLLGNGDGTFATEVAFAAGDGPLSVTLGDLNGDGRLDITTANFNSGDASVLLNSLAFTGQTATVDAIAPTAPTITSITDGTAASTGPITPGGFTKDTALVLTGSAEAASTVSIYDGFTLLGTTTADNTSGAWSYTLSDLSNGSTYAFNATATDAVGNISPASSPDYSVTVDTTAPAAPTITSITDDNEPIIGTIAPSGFTNDTSLVLTGTAEAASTVSIYNGSTLLGTTTADNTSGAWSYSATGLANGSTYAFNAKATDASGTISAASSPDYSVTVDTTSPSPSPSGITSANSNGRYGFGSTITLQVAFSETVYVTGSPTLLLETGDTDRAAVYKSGSGTNTLSFDYTVQLGDRSADLEISSSAALSLQGGSIQDAAGNGASLTLPAPGAPGSLGAHAALVIDDSAPSAGTTFTTLQGASKLINKPVIINQKTDPVLLGSAVANTLLVFNNATPDSNAASGILTQINSNASNPSATVTSASDLISFRVSSSVSTSGDVSNLDVNAITTSAVEAFKAAIQEVDLYFPQGSGSGWNALYKTRKAPNNSIEYYLFNYDPLTGLGGMLLDRDGDGSIDGARLYLKDGKPGDFDETPNGQIDDPIGFTTLSVAPTLEVTNGEDLTVVGVEGTGLWVSLAVSSFSSSSQSNLEMYNNGKPIGAIGATLGSGPTGSQTIYLAAGSTLSFRSSNGAGLVNSNPALSIIPTTTATGFSLGLDADRNGIYNDLMLDISSAIAASSPASLAIARKQLSSSDAILDLTSIAATGITLTLDISTDCGLRNQFGFVKLELDPVTGNTYQVNGVSQDGNDGGARFRSEVLSRFINPYQGSSTSHRSGQSRQSISWSLDSSAAGYYAPVMITQGGEVLTFGASTASDGRQHVKLLGTNTFGFEDLLASQGSDWDFNDTKIRASVA